MPNLVVLTLVGQGGCLQHSVSAQAHFCTAGSDVVKCAGALSYTVKSQAAAEPSCRCGCQCVLTLEAPLLRVITFHAKVCLLLGSLHNNKGFLGGQDKGSKVGEATLNQLALNTSLC